MAMTLQHFHEFFSKGRRTKAATFLAVVLLFLISIAQLLRVVLNVKIVANGVMIPVWPSIIACIVAAILAILVWRESRRC